MRGVRRWYIVFASTSGNAVNARTAEVVVSVSTSGGALHARSAEVVVYVCTGGEVLLWDRFFVRQGFFACSLQLTRTPFVVDHGCTNTGLSLFLRNCNCHGGKLGSQRDTSRVNVNSSLNYSIVSFSTPDSEHCFVLSVAISWVSNCKITISWRSTRAITILEVCFSYHN